MISCFRVILLILPKCKLIWPHWIKKFCHSLFLSVPESISECAKCAGSRSLLLDFHPDGAAGICSTENTSLSASSNKAHAHQRSKTSACVHTLHSCAMRGALGSNIQSVIYLFTDPGNGSLLGFETFCTRLALREKTNDQSCFCHILMLSN